MTLTTEGAQLLDQARIVMAEAVPLNEPEATLEVRMAWRTGENSPKVLQLLDSARAVLQNQLAPTAEGDLTHRSPRVIAPKRA